MSTDHNIVQVHFSYDYNTIQPKKTLDPRLPKSQLDGLRKRLTDMDPRSLLKINGIERSINDDWSTWKTAMMTAINEFIPTKYGDSRRTWITQNILHLIRKKVTARKKFLRKGKDYLKTKFSQLRAEVKKSIQESRKLFYSSFGSTLRINPKRFWSVFKINLISGCIPNSMSRTNNIIPGTRLHANTPRDITTVFSEYFHSAYTNFSDESASTQFVLSPAFHLLNSFQRKCTRNYRT